MSPDSSTTDAPPSAARNWPLVLVSAVAILAVIGVVVVGINVGSGFGAVAYTVNGTKVSQQTVNDELSTLADHNDFSTAALAAPFKTSASAVAGDAASTWLTVQIFREVGLQTLAKRGKSISDADRSQALSALFAQAQDNGALESSFRKLPSSLRVDIADLLALQNTVTAKVLKAATVSVDPKYGFWSHKLGRVCSPAGCPRPTASSGSSSTSGG